MMYYTRICTCIYVYAYIYTHILYHIYESWKIVLAGRADDIRTSLVVFGGSSADLLRCRRARMCWPGGHTVGGDRYYYLHDCGGLQSSWPALSSPE